MPERSNSIPAGIPVSSSRGEDIGAAIVSPTDSIDAGNSAGVPPIPAIGTRVTLLHPLSYLKTAESRPMLRPPDLVDPGEIGQVIAHQALGQCAVRFRRGSFLIEARDLRSIEPGSEPLSD